MPQRSIAELSSPQHDVREPSPQQERPNDNTDVARNIERFVLREHTEKEKIATLSETFSDLLSIYNKVENMRAPYYPGFPSLSKIRDMYVKVEELSKKFNKREGISYNTLKERFPPIVKDKYKAPSDWLEDKFNKSVENDSFTHRLKENIYYKVKWKIEDDFEDAENLLGQIDRGRKKNPEAHALITQLESYAALKEQLSHLKDVNSDLDNFYNDGFGDRFVGVTKLPPEEERKIATKMGQLIERAVKVHDQFAPPYKSFKEYFQKPDPQLTDAWVQEGKNRYEQALDKSRRRQGEGMTTAMVESNFQLYYNYRIESEKEKEGINNSNDLFKRGLQLKGQRADYYDIQIRPKLPEGHRGERLLFRLM